MANQQEFDSKIAQIIAEWNKAEIDIKTAEQIGGKVVFPSIKELRYAGRRIVDALDQAKGSNFVKALEYLVDAHFDCCRARHDAIDASISIMAAEISVIISNVGYSTVFVAFPEFAKLNAMIIDSQKLIASSRRDREQRERIYASVEGVPFEQMVEAYRVFKSNDPVMRSIAKSERRKQFATSLALWVSLLLAAFSAWAGWPQIKEQLGIRSAQTTEEKPAD